MEIILIVIGVLLATGSFLLPDKFGKKKSEETENIAEIPTEYIVTEENVAYVKQEIQRIQKESAQETAEQTEDMLNKIANEKIMSISELSEQILEKISQNHKEVIFLYDLLNDKEQGIKKHLVAINESKKTADFILETYGNDLETMKEMKKLNDLSKRSIMQMNGIIKKEKLRQQLLKQEMSTAPEPIAASVNTVEKTEEDMPEFPDIPQEEPAAEEKPFNVSKQNRNDEILALYQENYSIREIARKLSMGQGEVKLVLDLFLGGKP